MRESGVRGVLVWCTDYRCSHYIEMSADRSPDDLRVSDIEHRFVCTACGRREPTSARTSARGGSLWGSDVHRNSGHWIGVERRAIPPKWPENGRARQASSRARRPSGGAHAEYFLCAGGNG